MGGKEEDCERLSLLEKSGVSRRASLNNYKYQVTFENITQQVSHSIVLCYYFPSNREYPTYSKSLTKYEKLYPNSVMEEKKHK